MFLTVLSYFHKKSFRPINSLKLNISNINLSIAAECERFLAPKGYAGIQISPPNENSINVRANYPWWQRYQPVSYKLVSRSGTEAEFIDMVQRCNAVGVNIYVDAIINHMSGNAGNVGGAGSAYNSDQRSYPGGTL